MSFFLDRVDGIVNEVDEHPFDLFAVKRNPGNVIPELGFQLNPRRQVIVIEVQGYNNLESLELKPCYGFSSCFLDCTNQTRSVWLASHP